MPKNILVRNFAIIFFFGFVSGLPIVLILSTLKALLIDHGFSIETVGFFALVTLPYTLKFSFAPIIDSFGIPYLTKIFGQRRSWILLTQILLAVFIMLLGQAAVTANLLLITIFAFSIAFLSASQDLVIDAYRIELIKKEDQGIAASCYVYGYRIGMLVSGAGALIMADLISWDKVYLIMAFCMLIGILTTLVAKDTRPNWKNKNYNFSSWLENSVVEPLKDLAQIHRWYFVMLFIVCFKLSDAFAGNMILPFLLDIDFSKTEIAKVVKTFGLFATLFGIFLGGVLVKKIGISKSLWIAAIMQIVSNFGFSYQSLVGNEITTLYLVIFIENLSGGIGDSVFVAYLSGLCNVNFSATQYALLVSLATLARSVISSFSGVFAKYLGWYEFFIFSALIALPGLVFLYLVNTKNTKWVRKRKNNS